MRTAVLNNANLGINRLRTKGGAAENSLYDLINGFVNLAGTIQSRPGTDAIVTLPANTKGMVAYNEKLYVFSHEAATPDNALVVVEVIVDPMDPSSPIKEIHFAAPYLGYLYVAAEFESGNTYHYWGLGLTSVVGNPWEADTAYKVGDFVTPTVPNGFRYRARRLGDPNPLWAPDVARSVDDVVEPTVANGFKYTVIDTVGDSPKSGKVEPVWPAYDEGVVVEDVDLGPPAQTPADPTGPSDPGQTDPGGSQPPPPGIRDRYGRWQER